VFHFLTNPNDQRRYIELGERSIPIGGHMVIGTFALDGPNACNGLPVEQYSAPKLANRFGDGFALRKELRESHRTACGASQQFQFAMLERQPACTQS
jgi:hypothetical protein